MKKKVAILFGGYSTEYAVSLQSASAVIRHINTDKYEPILMGITRQGQWLQYGGTIDKIMNDTWYADENCVPAVISPSRDVHGILVFKGNKTEQVWIDVVFPVMHGKNGEDGTVQGLLQLSGIPFVGCDTLSSALCMEKDIAHMVAQAAGIKIPPFTVVRKTDDFQLKAGEAEELGYPLFVKPARAGSSFGISKVRDRIQLLDAMLLAFEHDNKVVIEQLVQGFEVGCAVLGNEKLTVGEIDEIELTQGFFDYTEKYTLKTSKIHVPARIGIQKVNEIKETALKLFRILGCKGFARVDMFLTPDGEIFFNEINTIPGLTPHSRYPSMLGEIGLSFEEIVDRLVELAVEYENVPTY